VDGSNRVRTLDDYRGKVVVLNIWATWCPPCKVEMPSMERLHRKLAGTDFQLVAVSVDEQDSSVVNQFVTDMGLTFQVLHNQDGTIRQIYQTTGVPESFVIDRDGVIVKKVIGAADWDAPVNEHLIRHLLDAAR
jgi:thiol-disulfide isomerase/thioredoxin